MVESKNWKDFSEYCPHGTIVSDNSSSLCVGSFDVDFCSHLVSSVSHFLLYLSIFHSLLGIDQVYLAIVMYYSTVLILYVFPFYRWGNKQREI